MKKSDIALLILIASISVVAAFFIGKAVFGDVYNGKTTVKTIEKIDSSIVEPSTDIFNTNAINPTVKVQINGSN